MLLLWCICIQEGSYITPGDEREDEEESDDKNTDNDAEPYLVRSKNLLHTLKS